MKIEQMYHGGGGGYNRKTNDNLGAFNEQKSIEKKQIDCKNHNLHTIDDESNDCVIDKISLIECPNSETEKVSCTKEIRYETKSKEQCKDIRECIVKGNDADTKKHKDASFRSVNEKSLNKCAMLSKKPTFTANVAVKSTTKVAQKTGKLSNIFVAIIFVVSIICTALTLAYFSLNDQRNTATQVEAYADSGYCGNNVTYKYDYGEEKLIISGTGAMYDYGEKMNDSPFFNMSNRNQLNQVVIEDGVTSIGTEAFADCENLISITIPDSVITISDNAFYGCRGLVSVTLGSGLVSIGEFAFNDCLKLTSITIPDSVITIGEAAFNSCEGLISATLGSGLVSIGEAAFGLCKKLTSIIIPNKVASIANSTFRNCNNLKSVTIGSGVSTIGSLAFGGCDNLESITIDSRNVRYNSSGNCNAIIETSSKTLIMGCKGTKIPDGVTSIGDSAFHDCGNVTSITIPDSVTSIGRSAFSWCTELSSVTFGSGVTNIGYGAFSSCSALTSVTIPDGVTSIGQYAFSWCTGLSSVVLGNGVTNIDSAAFSGCRALTNITIPNSVTSVGKEAFINCGSLISVTIYGENATIGDSAIPANAGMIIYGYDGSTAQTYATNNNITFQALEKTTTVTFQVSFTNETLKGGIFIYILRDNESGSGYAEFYSYYYDGKSNNQSMVYDLLKNATYRVVTSKPYVWDFSISGTGFSNTSFVNNKFTFTTTSSVGVVTIGTTGGTPPNTFTVV